MTGIDANAVRLLKEAKYSLMILTEKYGHRGASKQVLDEITTFLEKDPTDDRYKKAMHDLTGHDE